MHVCCGFRYQNEWIFALNIGFYSATHIHKEVFYAAVGLSGQLLMHVTFLYLNENNCRVPHLRPLLCFCLFGLSMPFGTAMLSEKVMKQMHAWREKNMTQQNDWSRIRLMSFTISNFYVNSYFVILKLQFRVKVELYYQDCLVSENSRKRWDGKKLKREMRLGGNLTERKRRRKEKPKEFICVN